MRKIHACIQERRNALRGEDTGMDVDEPPRQSWQWRRPRRSFRPNRLGPTAAGPTAAPESTRQNQT
eukprot:8891003-Pyramimonas_sp.AAC.1